MSEDGRRIPPLNALKAFEASARKLSFSQAADELSVTPGAISQQIRILENHAGGPLFRRDGRSIALTELGATLQPVLRDAFDQLKKAGEIIYGASHRSSLAVSVPPSFAVKWLAPRMASFAAANPDVEVWISADMQLADVAGGRVDLAVRYGRGDYTGVRTEVLLDAGVIPVCSPGLTVGEGALRRPADLAHHVLIHVGRGAVEEPRPDWAAWVKSRKLTGIDVSQGTRFDQTAMAIEAAAHGRGVALAPHAFVAADIAAGRLVAPFADGYLPTDMAYRLLTRRTGVRPEAQAFIRWLREEAAATGETRDEL
jgi:LysR family glycine cleavage system transcriptional activator